MHIFKTAPLAPTLNPCCTVVRDNKVINYNNDTTSKKHNWIITSSYNWDFSIAICKWMKKSFNLSTKILVYPYESDEYFEEKLRYIKNRITRDDIVFGCVYHTEAIDTEVLEIIRRMCKHIYLIVLYCTNFPNRIKYLNRLDNLIQIAIPIEEDIKKLEPWNKDICDINRDAERSLKVIAIKQKYNPDLI